MGVTQTKVKGPMLYTFHLPHKSLATCQCKSMRLLKTADKKQKNGNFGECDVHLVKFLNGVDEPTLGEYGSDKVLLKVSLNYIINGEIVYKIKNRSCRHEIWQHQGTTRRCVMWFEENDKFESFLEQLRKILCDIILCTTVEEPFYNFTIVIVQRGNQTRTNDDYTNRIEASHKLHRATTFYTLDEDIQARYVGERLKQTPRTNKELSESQDNLTAENLSILDTTNTSVKPIPTPRTTIKLMQEAEVEKKYLDSLSNPDINFDYESDTEVYSAHVDVSLKTEDKRVELEPPDMADVALHAELLQMSINSRDKKQVHDEIETLINYRALVSVEATSVWPENSDTFRIKVNIEDKDTSGKFIKLKVMKIDTIADLKNKMFIKHGLAKEIQHWIVGDAVPAENVSLGDLGVTGPEYSLFLYLASQKLKGDTRVPASTTDVMDVPKPKNDGSKRKQVKSAKQQEMDKISFVQMQQNGGVGSPEDEHIQLLTVEEKELKCANKVSTTSCLEASTEHDDTGKRVFENKSHNGWMCPSCTFHNYATRPGCEQCSCLRPEDYVVPDDNVVPPEERRRMELESKADTDFAREKESICANKVSTTSRLEASTEHDDTGKRIFKNKYQINKFKQQKLKRKPQEKNIVKVVTVNGWMCPSCTFHNYATRPGCEQCSCLRPEDYVVPDDNVVPPEERRRIELESKADTDFARAEERIKFDKDAQRRLNCKALEDAEHRGLILNTKLFECPVCFDNITIGKGVILRECLHQFCKDCLAGAVRNNEEVQIQCPFQDDTFACGASILDLEVKELVTDDIFDKYMARRLAVAEAQVPNSFHCKTVDCKGFCIYDDNVNIFVCMVCHKQNCLTCKVIHQGINCKEYQDNLKLRKDADVAAKQSLDFLDEMVKIGKAMHCPQCKIVIQKINGCDGIQCSVCKTEICWATKGPRWGPNGHGDRSGGCNCSVEKRCHPNCRNCH